MYIPIHKNIESGHIVDHGVLCNIYNWVFVVYAGELGT